MSDAAIAPRVRSQRCEQRMLTPVEQARLHAAPHDVAERGGIQPRERR